VEALGNCGAVAARLSTRGRHWRRVSKIDRPGGSVIASSPLHFPRRWRPAKTTTNATTFDFSFIVSGSASRVCFICLLFFLLLPMQICYGVWSDSPATCTVEDTLGPVDRRPFLLLWPAVRQTEV